MDVATKLLIIDDNEEILSSLNRYLSRKGYKVVRAANGLTALKQLEAANYDFDLVITDLVMPNISGVAITTILKKHNPRMPIIAITGYGEQPGSLAKEAHADIVMDKPFKLDEIEATIQKLLKHTK
ncbi:MAG: response regulator [Deltaproteobacteria bacterium]|nr:response regulator [Deltaproteobacteria bacterium]